MAIDPEGIILRIGTEISKGSTANGRQSSAPTMMRRDVRRVASAPAPSEVTSSEDDAVTGGLLQDAVYPGGHIIKDYVDGKPRCLDAGSGPHQNKVGLEDCEMNRKSQMWYFANDRLKTKRSDSKCLAATSTGDNFVMTAECGDDQKWFIVGSNLKYERDGQTRCIKGRKYSKADAGLSTVYDEACGHLESLHNEPEALWGFHDDTGWRHFTDTSTTSSTTTTSTTTTSTTVIGECDFEDWSEWSECSVKCGRSGTEKRSRTVRVSGHNGGEDCTGQREQIQPCMGDRPLADEGCPIPCELNDWQGWGGCSATCGGGKKVRHRTILHVAKNDGTCNATNETAACNTQECPVPCKWKHWGHWGECSATCGGGQKHRYRHLKNHSSHGGRKCHGKADQAERCNEDPCP
eukprot:gnl/TRDRNA2_/TRDRNA2_186255_c0_seq1.p1 gnl/TRDRNA2_/TRDRNA2_186255_c0~~gnl/TRDRNA2_/TRDRNA2_186255_c0_seq1.p1  ORF type:complete len:406 (-),score=42.07 gnl/TRDRNA2_/TRDRNA2_186255_c0_seq1:213-1430(-)